MTLATLPLGIKIFLGIPNKGEANCPAPGLLEVHPLILLSPRPSSPKTSQLVGQVLKRWEERGRVRPMHWADFKRYLIK